MGQGLLALDFDVKNGQQGATTLQNLASQGLPLDTLNSTTPSDGFHFLYSVPAGMKIANSAGLLPGLDIRCGGGYIVAAPSVMEQGAYVWNNPDAAILEAPPLVLELVTKKESASKSKSSTPEFIADGGRNTYIIKKVGQGIRLGLEKPSLMDFAHKENNLKCSPPLSDSEIEKIVNTAFKN